jgi:CheY-like chemotaxis protein
VKVDAGQLEQVLMNLAINARDAMPTGGKLTMETSIVELDADFCRGIEDLAPGGYVMIAVSDTGVGIPAALRSRIFEPFFTTKPIGRGTGLGLATVHGIIKQSRGHITVYSEENFGTTFKVYLPVVHERLTPIMNAAVTDDLPSGNETVLLVEDDVSVREFAAHIMKMCGYRVLVASNGETALALCAAEPGDIHLVVSDVVMPKMSGRELAERLATTRPACRILFLSGYTDDVVVRHGILTDDFAFLQKPFSSSALARKVRAELDR